MKTRKIQSTAPAGRLIVSYIGAAGLVALTLWIRLALDRYTGGQPVYILWFLPILLSAHFGGLGPGLLATALSVTGAGCLSALAHTADEAQLLLLAGIGGLLCWLIETKRRSGARAAQVEARLQTEARSRNVLETLIEGCQIVDFNYRYLYVNPAAAAQRRRTREEFIGFTIMEKFPGVESTPAFSLIRRCLETRKPGETEQEFTHADGSKVWFQIVVQPVDEGVFILTMDITERKCAAEKLREQEAKWHAADRQVAQIIHGMNEGCFALDPQWRFTFVNDRCAALARLRHEDMVGRSIWEVLPQLAGTVVEQHYRRAMAERIPMAFESFSPVASRWLEVRLYPSGEGLAAFLLDIQDRKEAEAAARDSQALYHSLLNQMQAGFFRKDAAGRFLFINSYFCRLREIDPEDYLGRTPLEVLQSHEPELAAQGARHHEHIMRTGEIIEIEEEYVRQDGTRLHLHVVKSPVYDAAGKITGSQGMLFDITRRKQAEDAIQNERNLLRTVMDVLPDFVYVKDTEHRFVMANELLVKYFGKTSSAELLGRSDADFFSAEEAARYQAAESEVLAGRSLLKEESVTRFPNGEARTLITTKAPLRDRHGRVTGLVGFGYDITEQKRIESELHRREEYFRLLIENASDIITTLNHEGKIIFSSPSAERVLGYRQGELTGQSALNYVHPEDVHRVAANLQKILTNPQHKEMVEYRFLHKNGKWRTIQSIGRVIPGGVGAPVVVANSRDVTESRSLEQQLRQSQKLEAIGRLAGGVAHDFNNILAVIMLQSDLLQMDDAMPGSHPHFAREISKAAQRASDLTRQLLLFSRQQIIQPADCNLNDIITNIAQMLQRLIGEDVKMHIRCAPGPLPIHADAGMLGQVLMNLAVNARDAMPKGGELFIESAAVQLDEETTEFGSVLPPGPYACLTVRDTGCGIPRDILPQIFDPFFTTKDIGKGTGLGLATVFGIMQQHHGGVRVESQVGHGATFHVYFPSRTTMAAEPPPPLSVSPAPAGKNETILVVEDDPPLRELIQNVLTHHGYHVLSAGDSQEALGVWGRNAGNIRLLLTDVVLPEGLNGIELSRQILRDNPHLRVIYTSGYGTEAAAPEFPLHAGVNFLAKPFEINQLSQIIRTQLDTQPG